jgi:hypothetical protein
MILRTNKCPQCWKEGKTMMLSKPVANKEEKTGKLETNHINGSDV